MKKVPVSIPEGSIRVRCVRCKKFHVIKKGEYYTCPKSISGNSTEGWYLFVWGKEVEQTSHFENVKVKLGLGH